MAKTVVDWLRETIEKYPDKVAFVDENESISYKELNDSSRIIAKKINKELNGLTKEPVAVFLDKSVKCIKAFFSVIYSGNFYTLLDTEMPEARINKILEVLEPVIYITDDKHYETVSKLAIGNEIVINIDQIDANCVCGIDIDTVYRGVLNSDVMYVLFTSGSTGIPKGVVTPHRAVVRYIESLSKAYNIEQNTIIGNQVPFYFVMSIVDIFATVYAGATMHIIPKKYFVFIKYLVRYIEERKINFVSWVPSALCLISSKNAFEKADLSCLKTVIFGGEVMPIKQLNRWRMAVPGAKYINGYGPTEVTDGCTYYVVDRNFEENEILPIGIPFENSDIIILDENNKVVNKGEKGELCVRSDSMTYGYYGDFEKTSEVFVQNPLNTKYTEIIYRTGDLVLLNDNGDLEYIGRKDFQIKYMGRRIELGEIESNVSSVDEIEECCCLYDENRKLLVIFYVGEIEEIVLGEKIRSLLPDYMRPSRRVKLSDFPHNVNGKIDRNELKKMLKEIE